MKSEKTPDSRRLARIASRKLKDAMGYVLALVAVAKVGERAPGQGEGYGEVRM